MYESPVFFIFFNNTSIFIFSQIYLLAKNNFETPIKHLSKEKYTLPKCVDLHIDISQDNSFSGKF